MRNNAKKSAWHTQFGSSLTKSRAPLAEFYGGVRPIKYQQIGIDDRRIAFEGVFQHSERNLIFVVDLP